MIRRLLQAMAIAALLALLWPEFARYRAEYQLKEVGARMERALTGKDRGEAALQSVSRAQQLAHSAAAALPGDARAPMLEGIALILMRQGEQAIAVLTAAIAQGERPEFTINLGRARSVLGDEVGARRAFLRTAWASPTAIFTLPKATQEQLVIEVRELEAELRAGRLRAPPPLD